MFFSIGHSTRALDEFAALLAENRVGLVADVRHFPRSRRNPQFNVDTLPDALAAHQIGYAALPALGGRRGRSGVDPATNALWRVDAFHHYADYAPSAEYAAGLAELVALQPRRPAIMCAEAVWWRCHRRIVTDWLLASGHEVVHILSPGHADPASMTPGSVVRDGQVTYPA